jgi:hypothetical protein
MNEKINQYLDGVFAPYDGVKSVAELKADLLSDLQERFRELKAEGKDDETAFTMTIDSIGDIDQTVIEVANLSRSLERQVLTNFSASNLPKSDLRALPRIMGMTRARCAAPIFGRGLNRQFVFQQRCSRSQFRRNESDRLHPVHH